ncbi:MAG TPA: hypothetical protein PKC19_17470 [Roseiflexaceae bacterium]|nr:hypothetical protein [Roseiflexaceae bacterium]
MAALSAGDSLSSCAAAAMRSVALTRTVLPWYGFGALSANIVGNMVSKLVEPTPDRFTLAVLDVIVILMPLLGVLLLAAMRRLRLCLLRPLEHPV